MKYYLVTDATAEEVERLTGMRGHNTRLGALVEKPKPFNMGVAMAVIDRALNPTRCICGKWAIIHQSNCPFWNTLT